MLFGLCLNELQQWGRDFILRCASLQLFANLQKLSVLPLLAEAEEVFSSSFMKKLGRGLCAVLGAELADVQAQLIFPPARRRRRSRASSFVLVGWQNKSCRMCSCRNTGQRLYQSRTEPPVRELLGRYPE